MTGVSAGDEKAGKQVGGGGRGRAKAETSPTLLVSSQRMTGRESTFPMWDLIPNVPFVRDLPPWFYLIILMLLFFKFCWHFCVTF